MASAPVWQPKMAAQYFPAAVPKAVQDSVRNLYKFPRDYRLRAKHDFQSVFAASSKATQKYLLALKKPNQLSHARLGIIIPKQHLRLAVQRNQLRRLIRESFRHHKEALKGLDIIVLLRSKCTPLNNDAIRGDLKCLWQKLITS